MVHEVIFKKKEKKDVDYLGSVPSGPELVGPVSW